MSIIDDLNFAKDFANKAKEIYSQEIFEELEKKVIEVLRDKINSVVNKYAKESKYNLSISNESSSEIKLYDLVYRVKSPESLREKILRDQLYYPYMKECYSDIKDFLIEKIDDLLGLKYLVSLSCDCDTLFSLLKDKESEFEKLGIKLTKLNPNPQKMRNGRSIYRIKGEYNYNDKKTYLFELQIKSKVDSAWADVEHMLFYKDYNFSYIHDTNKDVMTKLGDLLDEVDDLMVQIRRSQESYEIKKEELEFTAYLGSVYQAQIFNNVGSTFVLDNVKKRLFYLYNDFNKDQKCIIKEKNVKESGDFNVYSINKDNLFERNYENIRNSSIELYVCEHIFKKWLTFIDCESYCSEEIIENKFLKLYVESVLEEKIKDYDKYIDNKEISLNEFSKWVSSNIINLLKEYEITVKHPIFWEKSEIIFMLYSFYDSLNVIYNEEISHEKEEKNEINDSSLKVKTRKNTELSKILDEVIKSAGSEQSDNMKDEVENEPTDRKEIFKKLIDYMMLNLFDDKNECIKTVCEELKSYSGISEILNRINENINDIYCKADCTPSGKKMPDNKLQNFLNRIN